MLNSVPFISGSEKPPFQLLSRFLPPVPEGIVSEWLKEKCKPGDLILDPFGTCPHLDVEAARSGFRVVVTVYNPISRFLLELEADPPTPEQLNSTLADLAISVKGNERLKSHIQSQYLTICNYCGKEVYAEAFIWDRGAKFPSSRIINCQNCFSSGQFPTTEFDNNLALKFTSTGLHRARALERVASLNDPDRVYAEEALSTYLPRAVYVLFVLINKADQLPVQYQRSFATMLLDAFDRANTMWPHPPERYRPRKLSILSRFRENNIWMMLENFVEDWECRWKSTAITNRGTPITTWPELPPSSGGICLFDGHLMDLKQQNNQIYIKSDFKAVVYTIPRPNQAYWTLSALWAGWLWGREATSHYKTVLRRRRYDWAWHCSALSRIFEEIKKLTVKKIPNLGLIYEAEPGFLLASGVAGWLADLGPLHISLRPESGQIQLHWLPEESSTSRPDLIDVFDIPELVKSFLSKIDSFLTIYAEPASYMHLLAVSLQELVKFRSNSIETSEISPADVFSHLNSIFYSHITDVSNYTRFGGGEHSPERGDFWFTNKKYTEYEDQISRLSNSDRIELLAIQFMNEHNQYSLHGLDRTACQISNGLFTPSKQLVRQCMRSYSSEVSGEKDIWIFREEEKPKNRIADIEHMQSILTQIGHGLNFGIQELSINYPDIQLPNFIPAPPLIIWKDTNNGIYYIFFISTSAIITFLFSIDIKNLINGDNFNILKYRSYIVIPGSRSGLIDYKFSKDERLSRIVKENWNFVKFRHLRRLENNRLLRRENLDEYLGLDPLANSDPQIPLL